MKLTAAEPSRVRYASSLAVLDIWYGYGFEVEVMVGPSAVVPGVAERHFGLELIRAAAGRSSPWPGGVPQAASPRALATLLAHLAADLARLSPGALSGDPAAFVDLQRASTARAEEASAAARVAETRARAKEAWDRGAFTEAASLYSEVEADLSPADHKRMTMARARST